MNVRIVRTNKQVVAKPKKTVVNINSSSIKRTAVRGKVGGGCCLKRY